MKASVIVPCYNCEKTISRTIEALLAQTKAPTEIILVDDGSTDGTKQEIAKFGKRVKYFYQKNGGPAKARNRGAKEASGEVILFTDSDCVPENPWLAEMTSPFSEKKVSGVQGSYKTRQRELIARFGQVEIEERYERMKSAKVIDWVGSYSAAFRRNEFLALGGYDETFPIASGEDPEFSYRLSKNGGKLIFNPRAEVYHTHPATLKKYLKTKFLRAYYRPKMYSKHKEKALNDSYTPQLLKVQIGVAGLIVASAIASIWTGPFFLAIFVSLFIISSIPFARFAAKKDPVVAIASPAILFLRSIVFAAGLAAGVIKG